MKIFCSGIGGIGLSAYASLQRHAGHTVFGSDRSDSALIQDLRSQGITVALDQSGAAIPDGTDLLVYSEAIPPDAPERKKATKLGIRQLSYPAAVGEMQKGYRLISVCGTHGKSSTTAMVTRLMIEAGLDPTVIVGTKLRELDGRNWRVGKSDLFVLESCEYRRSFLFYDPQTILLTTCDGDHFDYYTSQEDYESAFLEFFRKLKPGGSIITHGSDPLCKSVVERSGKPMIDADAQPLLTLKTPGRHMQQNARLVLALADQLKIEPAKAREIVSGYAGCWRRIEVKGESNGVLVIDDYGHHPAEVRATIEAVAEAYPGRRLVVAFQPHTHDRTLKLYEDFTKAFVSAKLVIIPNIYVARKDIESDTVDMPRFIADIARESKTDVMDGHSLAKTEEMLRSTILRKGDVLLCMGAGDITNLATRMVAV